MSNLTVKKYFDQENVQSKIQELLGSKSKQFVTNVLQVVGQNNLLEKADPITVFNAAMMGAMLELPLNPSLGLAYIVPYNNTVDDGKGNKVKKCVAQFQIGYKGLKQLAIRSGQFKSLDTKPVYEGQVISDNSFIGFHFDWKSKKSEKIVGYANRYQLINGFEKIFYMSVEDIHAHGAKYSKTYALASGNWKKDFHSMAMKTVAKLNLNSGEAPLSIEMQKAITFDQGVITDVETEDIDYVDQAKEQESIDVIDSVSQKKETLNPGGKSIASEMP